ncbi:hypothetical protein [Streptomyces sp. NBC_00728]|uniref:hypothetical protein n=1 Tax=Streptomyces sp. NBC_00728 TaxID=2903676 RepID=UPI003870E9D0
MTVEILRNQPPLSETARQNALEAAMAAADTSGRADDAHIGHQTVNEAGRRRHHTAATPTDRKRPCPSSVKGRPPW